MIAKEGFGAILIGLALTTVLMLSSAWLENGPLSVLAFIAALLTLFTVYFFRDPERRCPRESGQLVAPADGRILGVERIDRHDFIGGEAIKVSIFLSIFDVHINRIPADGRIEYVKYRPGKFFKAFLDKASEENEQTEIGIATELGRPVVVKQIAGLIARRIVCRLTEGDRVDAGARFGMIRFGSRTELFLPVDADVRVKKGEHVKGGETVIGYLAASAAEFRDSSQAENVEL